MMQSSPANAEILRVATQQLRNVMQDLDARSQVSRWWLIVGYVALMGASMPGVEAELIQVPLYFAGCVCGLLAIRNARSSHPPRFRWMSRQK